MAGPRRWAAARALAERAQSAESPPTAREARLIARVATLEAALSQQQLQHRVGVAATVEPTAAEAEHGRVGTCAAASAEQLRGHLYRHAPHRASWLLPAASYWHLRYFTLSGLGREALLEWCGVSGGASGEGVALRRIPLHDCVGVDEGLKTTRLGRQFYVFAGDRQCPFCVFALWLCIHTHIWRVPQVWCLFSHACIDKFSFCCRGSASAGRRGGGSWESTGQIEFAIEGGGDAVAGGSRAGVECLFVFGDR